MTKFISTLLVSTLVIALVCMMSFPLLKSNQNIAFAEPAGLNIEESIESLDLLDKSLNSAIDRGDVGGYLSNNYRFHMVLYDAAEAEILLSISRGLWMRMGPSLRVVCGRFGTANLPDKHEEALEALRNSDSGAVAEAIRADIEQGIDQIARSL